MDTIALLGSTLGLGFVSGLRLYSTVLTVGLGVRFGLIHLDPALSSLHILTHPMILTVAAVIYIVEFFADKIPWVDSLWDSLHTFIRPIGAALIGVTAFGAVDPVAQMAIMLLCGSVALSGHSMKAGTRVLVNHSPEPFSNIGLSLFEDAFVVGGTWLSVEHPMLMLAVVVVFLVLFLFLSPKIFRLLRVEIRGFLALVEKFLSSRSTSDTHSASVDPMPKNYHDYWQKQGLPSNLQCRILCVAGKGVKGLRHSTGYFCLAENQAFFVTRRAFRFRHHQIYLANVTECYFKPKLLFDQLIVQEGKKQQYFYFFKDSLNRGESIFKRLLQRDSTRMSLRP